MSKAENEIQLRIFKKKVDMILVEALDLINELDENIGIETNNSFTMDFKMLRKKITDIIELI